jgi:hypothetical protein
MRRKRRKWQFSRTIELKILKLFMKNKWCFPSRITQNMNLKHKKFHLFTSPPQRNPCWENAFSASESAENDNFLGR